MTDPAPLTDEELDKLGREHVFAGETDGGCAWCAEDWPCNTVRLVSEVRSLRGVLDALADPPVLRLQPSSRRRFRATLHP